MQAKMAKSPNPVEAVDGPGFGQLIKVGACVPQMKLLSTARSQMFGSISIPAKAPQLVFITKWKVEQ